MKAFKVIILLSLNIIISFYGCSDNAGKPSGPTVLRRPVIRTISGTVQTYLPNKHGDLDKLQLRSGDSSFTAHFPPHVAAELSIAAPPGTEVVAVIAPAPPKPVVAPEPPPPPPEGYRLMSLKDRKGKDLLEIEDPPPPPPLTGVDTSITGVAELHPDTPSSAFVLKNCLVQMPPHLFRTIQPLISTGGTITVKGFIRPANSGLLNSKGLQVILPYRIIIKGIGYDVR